MRDAENTKRAGGTILAWFKALAAAARPKSRAAPCAAQVPYPAAPMLLLFSALQALDAEQTARLLRQIEESLRAARAPAALERVLCAEAVGALLHTASLHEKNLPAGFRETAGLGELAACDTIARLEPALLQALSLLCVSLRRPAPGPETRLADMLAYMRQNVSNSQFSMEQVAAHFQVPYKTLRARIRSETGKSLLDWFQSCRTDEIKRLLTDTDLDIEKIAHAVGYTSATSLIRSFRQCAGMSPGAFRDLYAKKP